MGSAGNFSWVSPDGLKSQSSTCTSALAAIHEFQSCRPGPRQSQGIVTDCDRPVGPFATREGRELGAKSLVVGFSGTSAKPEPGAVVTRIKVGPAHRKSDSVTDGPPRQPELKGTRAWVEPLSTRSAATAHRRAARPLQYGGALEFSNHASPASAPSSRRIRALSHGRKFRCSLAALERGLELDPTLASRATLGALGSSNGPIWLRADRPRRNAKESGDVRRRRRTLTSQFDEHPERGVSGTLSPAVVRGHRDVATNTGAVRRGLVAPNAGLPGLGGIIRIFNATKSFCPGKNIGCPFAFIEVNFPTGRAGLGRPRRLASSDHAADDRFRRRCQLYVSTSKWLGPIPFSSGSTHACECLADSG